MFARGEDRTLKRGMRRAVGSPWNPVNHLTQHLPRKRGIGVQVVDHCAHFNRLLVMLPAIVVGHQGKRRRGDLRFPGKPRLGAVGHADHRRTDHPVQGGLGAR